MDQAKSDGPGGGGTGQELYPGQVAELERQRRRSEVVREANADPLPGALDEAWGRLPESIGGLTVRPVVHYDFVILKRVKSPLLEQMGKAAKGEGKAATEWSDEQGYEIVYQFTRPVREVAAVALRGAEEFRAAAIEEIGMKVGPVEVALLVRAVEREFVRAFSTGIDYASRSTGDGTVFTVPPAGPKTGSAGG